METSSNDFHILLALLLPLSATIILATLAYLDQLQSKKSSKK